MRNERRWLIVILLLIAPAYVVAVLAPVVGGFLDDGVYLATAQSIATGHGYRIASLPGEIPQTKYPFLFPMTLAGVWLVFPSFPANVLALKLVPLLFGLLSAWAAWRTFASELGRAGAAWLAVLILALPWTVFVSTSLLSETLFGLLTWLALWRLDRAGRAPSGKELLTAAVLTSAAFLTRTSGAALIVAGVLIFWRNREWKQGVLFGLACVVFCSPWIVWQQINPSIADPVLAYYSKANYGQWNLLLNFEPAQKWAILWQNFALAALSPAFFLGFPGNPFLVLIGGALSVLALVGWWIHIRRGPGIVPVWCFVYFLLVMNWAWPPMRFLLVLAPAWILYTWTALRQALPRVRARLLAAVCLGTSLVICGFGLYFEGRETLAGGLASAPAMGREDWRELARILAMIGKLPPQDGVVAGILDPMYYFYSGKPAVRPFSEDPYDLYYSDAPGRKPLGDLPTLVGVLRKQHVSHIVVDQLKLFGESQWLRMLVDELQKTRPGSLTLEAQTGDGHFKIYRFHPEAAGAAP